MSENSPILIISYVLPNILVVSKNSEYYFVLFQEYVLIILKGSFLTLVRMDDQTLHPPPPSYT